MTGRSTSTEPGALASRALVLRQYAAAEVGGRARDPARDPASGNRRLEGYFVWLVFFLLLGYGLLGKGFAYLGVAPVFIGELVLCFGLYVWTGRRLRGIRDIAAMPLSAFLLIAFMAWGAARTLPYLSAHGASALRDGVVWGYGLFALIVSGVFAEPARLAAAARAYRKFAGLLLSLGMVVFLVTTFFGERLPRHPGSDVPLIGPIKGGDFLVHLAGVLAFLAATNRATWWSIGIIAGGLVMNVTSRAGLVAFACATAVTACVAPIHRAVPRLVMLALAGLAALWITGLRIEHPTSGRSVSFEQLIDAVRSLGDDTDRAELDGSKKWRLEWWQAIIDYTFKGEYFWTGKGFGVNLANDDGFQVTTDESLRSPHNGHLTILARAGVPGLFLWVALQLAWADDVIGRCLLSWRSGDRGWAGVFAFLLAYWTAFMVNAAFDVFLEGPVGGIWFWSLFGFGMAAVKVYDARPVGVPLQPPRLLSHRPLPMLPAPGSHPPASRRTPRLPVRGLGHVATASADAV